MTRKPFFLGLSMLCMMLPLCSQEVTEQPVEATSTERVNFAPGGIVRLNDSYGDLYVEGWDRPEVEIKTTKSTQGFYEPPKQKQVTPRLDCVRVVTERRSDTELAISTIVIKRGGLPRKKKGGVTVAYELRVPRGSRLVIHQSGGGFVLVANMTGDIEVTSRSGDVMLMVPDDGRYSIDAETKVGLVSSDFAGERHRRHVVGGSFASSASPSPHRIHLRIGIGGITIKKVPQEASLRTAEL